MRQNLFAVHTNNTIAVKLLRSSGVRVSTTFGHYGDCEASEAHEDDLVTALFVLNFARAFALFLIQLQISRMSPKTATLRAGKRHVGNGVHHHKNGQDVKPFR